MLPFIFILCVSPSHTDGKPLRLFVHVMLHRTQFDGKRPIARTPNELTIAQFSLLFFGSGQQVARYMDCTGISHRLKAFCIVLRRESIFRRQMHSYRTIGHCCHHINHTLDIYYSSFRISSGFGTKLFLKQFHGEKNEEGIGGRSIWNYLCGVSVNLKWKILPVRLDSIARWIIEFVKRT